MAADYTNLDAAILKRLPTNFNCLQAALSDQADALAKPDWSGRKQGWRVIDRRLQAMRKKGLIRFEKSEWHCAAVGPGVGSRA